jgi:hypothetical protein
MQRSRLFKHSSKTIGKIIKPSHLSPCHLIYPLAAIAQIVDNTLMSIDGCPS